jgi:uncharacterized protein with PQ loop repeat
MQQYGFLYKAYARLNISKIRNGTQFMLHAHARIANQRNKSGVFRNRKTIRIIDRCALVVGVLFPLTSLPQIFEILIAKDADGVSTITWASWVVLGLFWLAYGIVHKEKPIIISNIMWIILETIVVILSIIY